MDSNSIGSNDQDEKPKRQRRSYSCGPCKNLKIKCDLKIPCSSCTKFRRANKCLADPPQPPSEEELNKIKRRKTRSERRKQLNNDAESNQLHSHHHHQHQHLHQHPHGPHPPIPSAQAPPAYNHYPQFYPNVFPPSSPTPVNGLSVPAPYQCYMDPSHTPSQKYPYPGPMPLLLPHYPQIHSYVPSHIPPIPYRQPFPPTLPMIKEPSNNEYKSSSTDSMTPPHVLSAIKPRLNPVPQNSLPPIASSSYPLKPCEEKTFKYIETFEDYSSGLSEKFVNSNAIDTVYTFQTIIDDDKKDQSNYIELKSPELNQIREIIPRDLSLVVRLFDLYNSSYVSDHLLDNREVINKYWNFQKYFINQFPAPITDDTKLMINASVLKNLCLALVVFVNGYVFCETLEQQKLGGRSIESKWLTLSKKLKEFTSGLTKMGDFVFLANWYFIARIYYHYTGFSSENYFEFNEFLSRIATNEEFVELVQDKSDEEYEKQLKLLDSGQAVTLPESFVIGCKVWFQIRISELREPLFQIRGTLLGSSNFKDSVLPHKNLLKLVADLDKYETEEAHRDIAGLQKQFWSLYYKRFYKIKSIREMIQSYLYLYKEVGGLTLNKLEEFMKEFETQENYDITEKDVKIIVETQITLTIFVRWLSFVKLESTYFASLRYASYLTTLSALFNCFNQVDDYLIRRSGGKDNVFKKIHEYYGIHPFMVFYECLIYQGIFVCFLNNYIRDNETESNKIDLKLIYDHVLKSFKNILAKLNSDSYGGEIQLEGDADIAYVRDDSGKGWINHIPIFGKAIKASYGFLTIIDRVNDTHQKKQPSAEAVKLPKIDDLNRFIEIIEETFSNDIWEFLVVCNFGSRENFAAYCGKVWDLFKYIKSTDSNTDIIITKRQNLDMELLSKYMSAWCGLALNAELIDDYMNDVVNPNFVD